MCISPWNRSVGLYLVFDQNCGSCKGICEVFCQQLSVFLKISYLFDAHFEAIPNFFSLNKIVPK